MGLSSCIKKAEQFIKKQRNETMRKSGKTAADKLMADQTAALESLQSKLGDIASLNSDDTAAAESIRSVIEDLFIDRESLEIQVSGRGIEVKAAPFRLEDISSDSQAPIPEGWTSSTDFNDRDTFEYSPAGRDSNWVSVTHIGGAKEKGAYSVRTYEGRNAPTTEEIFGSRSSVLMQAKQAVDAKNAQPVHIEDGEIERVTPAVVSESLKKSAANTKFNPKEALQWLTGEVRKAVASAPDVLAWNADEHGFKVFDVPGDGSFKIKNAKQNLESFMSKVEASPGFKKPKVAPKPQLVAGWQKTGSAASESEIREMLTDGDYTAAYEFSKQIGHPIVFGYSAKEKPVPYTDVRSFEVEGYDDFSFVIGRAWSEKDGGRWHVVELSTGLSIANASTKKAVEAAARGSLIGKNVTPESLGGVISAALSKNEGKSQDVLSKEWEAWANEQEGNQSILVESKAEAKKPELQRSNEATDKDYRKGWHSVGVGAGGVIHYKRQFEFEGKPVEAVMWETAGRYDDGYVTYDGKKVFTARDTANGAQEQIDRFLEDRYLSQNHDVGTGEVQSRPFQSGNKWYAADGKSELSQDWFGVAQSKSGTYFFLGRDNGERSFIALKSDNYQDALKESEPLDRVSGNLENYIKIAADSIKQLRKVDVERVLSQSNIPTKHVADYIIGHRPDLTGEVNDVLGDSSDSGNTSPNPLTQTFEQWLDAEYESSEYKESYLRRAGGDVQQAKYQVASRGGDTEKQARLAYNKELFSKPRDADLSLEVFDSLSPDEQREASRHFFGIDAKWSEREQLKAVASNEREEKAIAPIRAELDKVNAELKKREKGPTTNVERKLLEKQSKLENKIADVKSGRSADAGEELTYNKRNRRKDGLKWEDISDKNATLQAKEVVKAKVYPKPDYEALVEGGMQPVVAHMVKQMYDGIASAPKLGRGEVFGEAAMKAYIDGVNRVMDGVMQWANDPKAVASWAARQSRLSGSSFSVMDTFSKDDTPLSVIYPNGWKERQAEVRYLGGNKFYGAIQPGYDEVARAMKDIKLGWPSKVESWQKQGYKVIEATGLKTESRVLQRAGKEPFVYVSLMKVGGRDQIDSLRIDGESNIDSEAVQSKISEFVAKYNNKFVLQDKVGRVLGVFDSNEAAEEGARNETKREKESGDVKEIGRVVTEVERVGAERRMEGQDVSAQDLVDTFGFRGVNFGNSMQGDSNALRKERQLHLNHIYDAFMDLADILNIPPKAVSLNGMLGIAVGAQGSGKALAHFVPGLNEINITRRAGAGALAHEWGHALDHYFGTMAGAATKQRPYMTELVSGPSKETVRVDNQWVTRPVTFDGVRNEVVDQFRSIVDAMKKRPETQEERQARLEDGRQKALEGVKQWIDYFRKEVGKADGDQSDALSKIGGLESRMNATDFGDGVISVGKNIEVHPVVAELKTVVDEATGKQQEAKYWHGISIQLDRLKAFDDILKSTEQHDPLIVDTNYLKSSTSADAKKKPYWSTTLEMFARALDAYVVDTLNGRGDKNQYLSGIEAVAPAGEERAIINKAFDFLFAELKTKETDSGTAIYNVDPFYDHYKNEANRFNDDPEWERSAIGNDGIFRDSSNGVLRRNIAGRSGRIEANGMPRWVRNSQPGVADYIGQKVNSAEDLSDIAQVYRDPRYETMRYFFVKDGVIVSQNAVSSRLPGSSSIFFGKTDSERNAWVDKISKEASLLGADGVYLLHNHPNGDPTASDGDMDATMFIANEMASRGIDTLAHVIINHNKYGVIAPDENGRISRSVVLKEYNAEEKYSFSNPKVAHPVLGSRVLSPKEVAKVAKQAQVSSGEVVVIGISGTSGVSLLAELTPAQISSPKVASAVMRRLARQSGSSHMYAYGLPYSSMSLMARAIRSGVIVDAIVIDENGTEWSVAGITGAKPEKGVHFGLSAYANEVGSQNTNVYTDIRFSKNAKQTNAATSEIRSALTNRFGDSGIRALEKTGMLKIMRLQDAPESIRKEAMEQGASALYTADGVAYLFSDRMTAEEAPGKLLHEIGEHHGLERMLGGDGWERMKRRVSLMAKSKGSVAYGAWTGVKDNYAEFDGMSDSELAENDRFMHEVLAAIGENSAGLKTSLWRELVAQVKDWLASKGFFTDSITEGDIANLVSGSLKKVMQDAKSGLVGQATMSDIAYDYFRDIVSSMKSNQLLIEDCA